MPQPLFGFGLDRKMVLNHHLSYNHYPPVDPRWVPIAEKAIDLAITVAESAVYENDEGGHTIDMSDLEIEVGQGKTAREVLDGLHLWDFVTVALQEQDEHLVAELEYKAGE